MRQKRIKSQIATVKRLFGISIDGNALTQANHALKKFDNRVDLLVVHQNVISTKDIFRAINLGCQEHNSWFLDLKNAYDLVSVPETSYVLQNVNIIATELPEVVGFVPSETLDRSTSYSHERIYSCEGNRPLTLHEVLNLALQYPDIFGKKIQGIQAYGSRFTKEELYANPSADDTMEIYRKGNVGNGFLKLAREQYRYSEDSKIIPFVEL